MKKITFQGLLIIFLFACNSQPQEKETVHTNAHTDSVKISESIRTNMSFLNDFTALEQVFGNENWLIADKGDTSYFYFSRLGNFSVNTYYYQRVKGDSANVIHSPILPEGNQISWMFNGQKLYVSSATRGRIVWNVMGADSLQYEFIRLDNNRISLSYPNKKKVILQKTLAFGLFLVRSRYDYAHGTKYAFDSTKKQNK